MIGKSLNFQLIKGFLLNSAEILCREKKLNTEIDLSIHI